MIRSRYVFAALYLVAVFIIVDQLAELAINLYPGTTPSDTVIGRSLGDARWRFAAFGLLVGRATALIMADGLLIAAALGLGHRGFLASWAWLHWVIGGVLLLVLVLFGLDALEVRLNVSPAAKTAFFLAAGRAGFMAILAVVYCGVGGWLAFRATRRQTKAEAAPALVVRGSAP